jgi:hypothetical protein
MNNVILKMCGMVLENTLQSQKPSRKRCQVTGFRPSPAHSRGWIIRQCAGGFLACHLAFLYGSPFGYRTFCFQEDRLKRFFVGNRQSQHDFICQCLKEPM